ncbi:AAA family ATPase [Candidatus Palauibacter sp.]|uniref:AAA family ATPase n=1 Tax=Candidatus Palauibacter sp. TaxID=3101350 RepID=UPI003AF2CFA3
MRFGFHHIGPVDAAEITLGDLTIIAGRNNTGKTYVTYALYGFLDAWYAWPGAEDFFLGDSYRDIRTVAGADRLPDVRELAKTASATGEALHTVAPRDLHRVRTQMLKVLAAHFSEAMLPAVFSSSASTFRNAAMTVDITEPFPDSLPPLELRTGRKGRLSIEYQSETMTVRWTGSDESSRRLTHMISHLYHRLLCATFPEAFILSAERFGISLFYKELDFAKSQLVDLLQKIDTEEDRARISPYLIIDRSTSRYALPIKDNIDYTRSLPDLRKKLGPLSSHRIFNEIKDMMEGYYKASGDDISFKSKTRGDHKFEIPLHLASSSARGLSDLYFFLKYVADENHLLIVDEPESHLDTTNQIQLARLLSRLVRIGIKVLITTHSDYLIKEINNLIMLSHLVDNDEATAATLEYVEADALPGASVRAYVADSRELVEARIDRFGIDMPVFDTTINNINKTSNTLAAALEAHESRNS